MSESFEYLKGSEIHFDDGLSGKGFEIRIQMLNLHVVVESLSVDKFFLSFLPFLILPAGEGKLVKMGLYDKICFRKNIPVPKLLRLAGG